MINVYAFKDDITGKFSIFDCCPNDAAAQRQFREWYAKFAPLHAADLGLYCVAVFNFDNGEVTPDFRFLEKGVNNA